MNRGRVCVLILLQLALSEFFLRSENLYDPDFKSLLTLRGRVTSVMTEPDDKILFSGDFQWVTGVPRNGIARLDPGGDLDLGFDPGRHIPGRPSHFLRWNEKILVSVHRREGFSTVMRFDSNGVPDVRWTNQIRIETSGLGGFPPVYLFRTANNKILLNGHFNQVNGSNFNSLAMLNEDGSLDGSFISPRDLDRFSMVTKAYPRPDGRILLIDSDQHSFVFDPATGSQVSLDSFDHTARVQCLAFQPDGKILLLGNFFTDTDQIPVYAIRLNADFSRDETFQSNLHSEMQNAGTLSDGRTMLIYGGVLGFLNTNGLFSPNEGFFTNAGPDFRSPDPVAMQRSGKFIVPGINSDLPRNLDNSGLVRYGPAGKIDVSFSMPGGVMNWNNGITKIIWLPGGQLLVSGEFSQVDGTKQEKMVRLNADGSHDPVFSPQPDTNTLYEKALAMLSDGSYVISASTCDSMRQPQLLLLNAAGVREQAFDYPLFFELSQTAYPLFNGNFVLETSYNGDLAQAVLRNFYLISRSGNLITNLGVVDKNDFGGLENPQVTGCLAMPDGSFILAGRFAEIQRQPRKNIARFSSQGVLETAFPSEPQSNLSAPLSGIHAFGTNILLVTQKPALILMEPDGRIRSETPLSHLEEITIQQSEFSGTSVLLRTFEVANSITLRNYDLDGNLQRKRDVYVGEFRGFLTPKTMAMSGENVYVGAYQLNRNGEPWSGILKIKPASLAPLRLNFLNRSQMHINVTQDFRIESSTDLLNWITFTPPGPDPKFFQVPNNGEADAREFFRMVVEE